MVMNFREGRNELAEDLQRNITKVVEERKALANYYILVASQVDNIDTDIIRNKLILLKEKDKPQPTIGTILFHVDNRKGVLTRIWVFPRDVLQPDLTINRVGDFSDEIFYHGKAPNR